MDEKFKAFADALHPRYEMLMRMDAVQGRLPKGVGGSGVYLFSEEGRHLYVGRTRNVRSRYSQHSRPSSKHNDAPFAFRLAREATGILRDYSGGALARARLTENLDFADAFHDALVRIRAMDFRFVAEADPTRQCLLEVYVSVVLGTPYNDFDTH